MDCLRTVAVTLPAGWQTADVVIDAKLGGARALGLAHGIMGQGGGYLLSQTISDATINALPLQPSAHDLRSAFIAVDSALRAYSLKQPHHGHVGAELSLMVTGATEMDHKEEQCACIVANVGLVRVWREAEGEVLRVTPEESLSELGLVDPAYRNILTKALGFGPVPEPFVTAIDFPVGARILFASREASQHLNVNLLRELLLSDHDLTEVAGAIERHLTNRAYGLRRSSRSCLCKETGCQARVCETGAVGIGNRGQSTQIRNTSVSWIVWTSCHDSHGRWPSTIT